MFEHPCRSAWTGTGSGRKCTVTEPSQGGLGLQLELSSEGRYALRALVYLAWLGEQATADRISAEAHIPRRLLARILANLSRAGLVESEQGRGGGSRLARPRRGDHPPRSRGGGRRPLRRYPLHHAEPRLRRQAPPAPCTKPGRAGQQAILEYLGGQTLDEFIEQNPLDQATLPDPNAPARVPPTEPPKKTLRNDRGRSYIAD